MNFKIYIELAAIASMVLVVVAHTPHIKTLIAHSYCLGFVANATSMLYGVFSFISLDSELTIFFWSHSKKHAFKIFKRNRSYCNINSEY
jgi:hypothetical protein